MLQDVFARPVGLVVRVDLHHDLVEVLDDIFELVCERSVSFVSSNKRMESCLRRPSGRYVQLEPSLPAKLLECRLVLEILVLVKRENLR